MLGDTDNFKDQWTCCLCIGSYKTQIWVARGDDMLAQHTVRTPTAVVELTMQAKYAGDSAWARLDVWLSELWLLIKSSDRRRHISVLYNTDTCPSFMRYVCRWLRVASSSNLCSTSMEVKSSEWCIDTMLTSVFSQRLHGVSNGCCVVIDVGHAATRITPIMGGIPAFEVMGVCGPVCGLATLCDVVRERIASDEAHRGSHTPTLRVRNDGRDTGGDARAGAWCSSGNEADTAAPCRPRRPASPLALLERAFDDYLALYLDSARDPRDRYDQLTANKASTYAQLLGDQDVIYGAPHTTMAEGATDSYLGVAGIVVADYLIAVREVLEMYVCHCRRRDMNVVWQNTVLCGGGTVHLPSLRHILALFLDELCPPTTLLWRNAQGDDDDLSDVVTTQG